jgi:hypothetical protein
MTVLAINYLIVSDLNLQILGPSKKALANPMIEI